MRLAPAHLALLIGAASVAPAAAQGSFDADTRCGAFHQAIGAENRAAIRAARAYILRTIEERDREYIAAGQGGMRDGIDENREVSLISAVLGYCDAEPGRSLRSAAIEAYDQARVSLGQVGRPR